MKKILTLLTLLTTVFLSANNLRINGFVSQGYIYSLENDYLVEDSQNGSSEFNEAGLTFSKNLSDKLRVGMQFLSRDFGKIGNNSVKLDWGFADYRWKDYLGIKIGKVKTPMGLYNEGRDIDFLRPMVFLPQSTYDEQYREYLVAFQGFDVYGNIPLSFGDIDYHLYSGNMNFNSSSIPMKMVNSKVNAMLDGLEGIVMTNGFTNASIGKSEAIDMKTDSYYGGTLFYNFSSFGTKIGASAFVMDGTSHSTEVNLVDKMDFMITGVDSLSGDPILSPYQLSQTQEKLKLESNVPYRYMLSAKTSLGNFTLSGEFSQQLNEISTDYSFDINVLQTNPETGEVSTVQSETKEFGKVFERKDIYYYGLLSYRFLDKYEISALYDVAKIDYIKSFNPTQGELVDTTDDYKDFQKHRYDYGLALRYDISFNWSVKLEGHMVDGVFRSSSDLLQNIPENELEDKWNYFVGKVSYNF